MKYNFNLLFSCLLTLLILLPISCMVGNKQPGQIKYTFHLSDTRDRIDVTMSYQRFPHEDTTILIIPTNYDRTKLKNSQLVTDLKLLTTKGELEPFTIDNYLYIGDARHITLSYSLPSISADTSYLSCEGEDLFIPAINREFFHMFGDKSLVLPYPNSLEAVHFNLEIEWLNFPEDWKIANDFGIVEFENNRREIQSAHKLSRSDIASSHFFGGKYRHNQFSYEDINFNIFSYGAFKFSDDDLIDILKRVANAEMQLWQEFHHDKEYIVSITQRGEKCGKLEGRSMYNSFSFYFSGKFKSAHLPLLFDLVFTHEFTHTWIGSNLLSESKSWESMKWFIEGFTDYYALRINLESGLISEQQYIDKLNQVIQLYLLSPYRESSLATYINNFKFDEKLEKLPYNKGAVFAFYLDGYIRDKSSGNYNLDDLMRAILNSPGKEQIKSNLNYHLMHDISQEVLGIPISSIIESHIVNGELIPIVSPIIDSVKHQKMDLFDYGFDFAESIKKEVVVGLKESTNAYQQGLRNGQKIVAIKQFAHQADQEVVLIVKSEEEESIIRFSPQGEKVDVPVILNN